MGRRGREILWIVDWLRFLVVIARVVMERGRGEKEFIKDLPGSTPAFSSSAAANVASSTCAC